MNLHSDKELFHKIIKEVSDSLGLEKEVILKDYWVTNCLQNLSKDSIREYCVFKGGTSLSKTTSFVERFSEDIDFAIKIEGLSASKVKSVITKLERTLSNGLIEDEGFENRAKSGTYRISQYKFENPYKNEETEGINKILMFGESNEDDFIELEGKEMKENIQFEIMTFQEPTPTFMADINSFIYEYLVRTERSDIMEKYDIKPFQLEVLDIRRTVCEKLAALILDSYQRDIGDLGKRVRHFYDLGTLQPLMEELFKDINYFVYMINTVKEAQLKTRFIEKYPHEVDWSEAPLFEKMYSSELKHYYKRFESRFVYGNYKTLDECISTVEWIHGMLLDNNL